MNQPADPSRQPSKAATGQDAGDSSGPHDVESVQFAERAYNRLRDEVSKVIVGHDSVIEQVLAVLFAGGHGLVEGVPGLAKTLLVRALSRALALSFKRIQFTPDLLPSDITGADILREDPTSRQREYQFLPGPIFAHLVLADEINRAPPKTQAAMLEAMQERQVTAGGVARELPRPFLVLATQNPIEQEGTYPLPEAQRDRFLLHIRVGYPRGAEEWDIARRAAGDSLDAVEPVLSADEIVELSGLVARTPVSDQVLGYAWALVRATRPGPDAPEFVNRHVAWGAGPRALLALLATARARAVMYGRYHASIGDVRALAPAALRHRLGLTFSAQTAGLSADGLVAKLLEAIPADRLYDRPVE